VEHEQATSSVVPFGAVCRARAGQRLREVRPLMRLACSSEVQVGNR
jgi:hypothetical protein